MILDPGFDLTLRPMKYPVFFDMFKVAIKNTWTVEEVDFSSDVTDLRSRMKPAEQHLIKRLVAFFATGDSIVGNNLVLNLYKHVNSPEARMYLSRQLYEEALHVQFYLTLLDTYVTDPQERAEAFAAVENIPSIQKKAQFCFKWMDSIQQLDELRTDDQMRTFLLNLVCFAACIEGLFFFAAFAYVYYLRSRGLLQGLATGTSWVFRDESCVADGTEILTDKGWKDFSLLEYSDRIAQFDTKDKSITFTYPQAIIHKPYNGDMVHLLSDITIDQLITPDHDVVQRWDYQTTYSKVKAADFKLGGRKMLPVAGFVKCPDPIEFTVLDRFKIAFQADGSLSNRYTGERCGTLPATFSFSKKRKIDRLRWILADLGWSYQEKQEGANDKYPNRKPRLKFRVDVPIDVCVPSKQLSDWVDLSIVDAKWCTDFIDEVMQWDAYTTPSGCRQYMGKFKSNTDLVQIIATLSGRRATFGISEDHRKETYSTIYSTFVQGSNKSDIYTGTVERTVEPYNGNVHCATVPTGAIVIRRNNKISITGNCHIEFALEVINTTKRERPDLLDSTFNRSVVEMIKEAVDCELAFAEDTLSLGVTGMSIAQMKEYLEYVADRRLTTLGIEPVYGSKNPFTFMELQDVQELTNFFERRVSSYSVGITGDVDFAESF